MILPLKIPTCPSKYEEKWEEEVNQNKKQKKEGGGGKAVSQK